MAQTEQPDFPAAHSMDTEWFGVDDLGNIARFRTGEAGAAPCALEVQAFGGHEGDVLISEQLTEKRRNCVIYEQSIRLNHNLPGPYDRIVAPAIPANLNDLTPDVRRFAELGRLPGTNFLEMPLIQPADHVPCDDYYGKLLMMLTRDRKFLVILEEDEKLRNQLAAHWRAGVAVWAPEITVVDNVPPPNSESAQAKLPPDDFPAAHSMDSAWFAIDRDGHVAAFITGEAGAMPESIDPENDPGDILARLREAGIEMPAPPTLNELIANWTPLKPGDPTIPVWIHYPKPKPKGLVQRVLNLFKPPTAKSAMVPGYSKCTMQLSPGVSLDQLTSMEGSSSLNFYQTIECPDGYLVHRQQISNAELSDYYAKGLIMASWTGLPPDSAALPGFYVYTHDDEYENHIAGPYSHNAVPPRPINCASIRADLVGQFGFVEFEKFCFADTSQLQPIEHFKCTTWSPEWVASDGKTIRAVPGREEDYRAEILHHQHGHQERDGYRFIDPDEPE